MRRHVFIGRFGRGDRARIPTARDETSTRLDLLDAASNLDHGLGGALDDLEQLGVFPTEIGFDLLVLAAHVHAADTRISRASESQDSWTREIRLVVPVGMPAVWEPVRALLDRMLGFLTGDRWAIQFRGRPKRFQHLVDEPPVGHVAPFDSIGLFSGGLDSLVGAIDELAAGRKLLLISHAGDGATSDAQNTLFDELDAAYPNEQLERLRLWMAFPDGLVRGSAGEKTTRGRSFLFLALGSFAGSGFHREFKLRVPENGLISLNVPLDPLRLGALSTRTTHPFFLARWNQLLLALGIPGSVENPYWNHTKGEMLTACRNRALLCRLLPASMSCSSPAKARWLGLPTQHCGYCMPCLIRRSAAVAAFGRQGDHTEYTIPDLVARALDTGKAEGQQVRAFQFAIDRLRREPNVAKLLIHKPGSLADEPTKLPDYERVYIRGMAEVQSLLAGVSTRAL